MSRSLFTRFGHSRQDRRKRHGHQRRFGESRRALPNLRARNGSPNEYDWSEEYTSQFWRDGRGAYTIDPSFFMPMVRDVPLFPDGDIAPGASWTALAARCTTFGPISASRGPSPSPSPSNYAYRDKETRDGVACAVFTISYEIFMRWMPPVRAHRGCIRRVLPALRNRSSGGTSRTRARCTTRRSLTSSTRSTREMKSSTKALLRAR